MAGTCGCEVNERGKEREEETELRKMTCDFKMLLLFVLFVVVTLLLSGARVMTLEICLSATEH